MVCPIGIQRCVDIARQIFREEIIAVKIAKMRRSGDVGVVAEMQCLDRQILLPGMALFRDAWFRVVVRAVGLLQPLA